MVSATRIYVPRDVAALAVGADAVAQRIAQEAARRGLSIDLVRNGTRGLFWLEPLVEVQTADGRFGFGPVRPQDVASLFECGFPGPCAHPLALGAVERLPYLQRQRRLAFARIGLTDPLSLADYEAHGGFAGLRRALAMEPAAIVQEVLDAGLRGRGGAAFPTGIKWRTALQAQADVKYVVCNADEGDSGSFADRLILEDDPFALIEGMTIAALAVGARAGYVYVRSEY
ncbi:MAG: formate dehydrogenase, partial [Burkholderiaceae bacterium]|nr:formate dehydrogenase [Burkholderiaceae bacterium]